ncbi:MAG: S8 family serine peptidase [Peptococcia bacterium]|jgi:hypothetical protein
MKRLTVIVMSLVVLCLLAPISFAQTEVSASLSREDEQAYQQAHASWLQKAEVNKAVGLPPFGDEPKRSDFIGIVGRQEAEAIDAARIDAERATQWETRLEEVRPYLRTLVKTGAVQYSDYRSRVAQQEKEFLMRVADERWANRDEVERQLDDIATRLGVERKMEIGKDRYAVLAGEMDGEPVWLVSQNQIAAASISADELWPTNTVPWPSSSSGLGLTGTNIVLGMWEVDGAVRESHYEFQNRVVQVDQSATNPISLNYHATGVAGTMAAGGVLYFTSPATGTLARGVAYQADVDSYYIDNFSSDLADATAGTTNEAGLRLSNHSWGLINGWQWKSVPGVGYAWTWWGGYGFSEDPKFGYYTPALGDGTGCVELDNLLATNATRHLLVYAAGNDRLTGPGSATPYYWKYGTNWYYFSNPTSDERDWINGDGNNYSFDTMAAPGTAKNVLTVGSVQDIFYLVGSQTNWGYATNSTVTLSSFSACGPTDDGRIKPDVVAVGEANSSARGFFAIVTADADSDTDAQYAVGTSFAAPGVTAGLAFPLQRRSQLFTNLTDEADAYRGSTLKGLAIHTADDVGTAGPDYLTGWGVFNAASSVELIEQDAQDGRGTHIKEIELSVGETNSWLVSLDGSNSFKVTALWSDPAGSPSTNVTVDPTTPMLVHNIDLRVETENGSQTNLPWVLNPDLTNKTEAARITAATTGVDDRNNVEQVMIASPTAGTYRIVVVHSGGLAGGPPPTNQWVSILTSGDTPLPPKVTTIEHAVTTNQFLLSFECDPGAYLLLESTTNLIEGTSWQQEGSLTTEAWSNAVLATHDFRMRFWRLRRETGE